MVGAVHLWSDHLNWVKILQGQNGGLERAAATSEHKDLWQEIQENLQRHKHPLQASWVNSHPTCPMDLQPNVDIRIYKGNERADTYADKGAKKHQVAKFDADEATKKADMMEALLERFATLAMDAVMRRPKD